MKSDIPTVGVKCISCREISLHLLKYSKISQQFLWVVHMKWCSCFVQVLSLGAQMYNSLINILYVYCEEDEHIPSFPPLDAQCT